MTKIYFVRHAQSDSSVRDGRIRPLTPQGVKDAAGLTEIFENITVHSVYSSPFKRAVDTVKPIALSKELEIVTVEDFRERKSDSSKSISIRELIKRQWKDFSYTVNDGESYKAVESRNIVALKELLRREQGNTVIIGTHGVSMSVMLNYFTPISIDKLERILKKMPYIACLCFEGESFVSLKEVTPV